VVVAPAPKRKEGRGGRRLHEGGGEAAKGKAAASAAQDVAAGQEGARVRRRLQRQPRPPTATGHGTLPCTPALRAELLVAMAPRT
jgi:hypothetical protein